MSFTYNYNTNVKETLTTVNPEPFDKEKTEKPDLQN